MAAQYKPIGAVPGIPGYTPPASSPHPIRISKSTPMLPPIERGTSEQTSRPASVANLRPKGYMPVAFDNDFQSEPDGAFASPFPLSPPVKGAIPPADMGAMHTRLQRMEDVSEQIRKEHYMVNDSLKTRVRDLEAKFIEVTSGVRSQVNQVENSGKNSLKELWQQHEERDNKYKNWVKSEVDALPQKLSLMKAALTDASSAYQAQGRLLLGRCDELQRRIDSTEPLLAQLLQSQAKVKDVDPNQLAIADRGTEHKLNDMRAYIDKISRALRQEVSQQLQAQNEEVSNSLLAFTRSAADRVRDGKPSRIALEDGQVGEGGEASREQSPERKVEDDRVPELTAMVHKLEQNAKLNQHEISNTNTNLLGVVKKTVDMIRDEHKRGTKDLWGRFSGLSSEVQAAIASVQMLIQRGEQVQRSTVDVLTQHHSQTESALMDAQARINAEVEGKIDRLKNEVRNEQNSRAAAEREVEKKQQALAHELQNALAKLPHEADQLRADINRAVRDIEASFARSEGSFNSALDATTASLGSRTDNLSIALERNIRDYQGLVEKMAEKDTEFAAREHEMDQRNRGMIYNSEEKFLRHAEQMAFDLRTHINTKHDATQQKFDKQFLEVEYRMDKEKKESDDWKQSVAKGIDKNFHQFETDAQAKRDQLRLECLDVINKANDAQAVRVNALTKDLDAVRDEMISRVTAEEHRREHDLMEERKMTEHAFKKISDSLAQTTTLMSEIDEKHALARDTLHDKLVARTEAEILNLHGRVSQEMQEKMDKETAARLAMDSDRMKLLKNRLDTFGTRMDGVLKDATENFTTMLAGHRQHVDILWLTKEKKMDDKLDEWETQMSDEFANNRLVQEKLEQELREKVAETIAKCEEQTENVQKNVDKAKEEAAAQAKEISEQSTQRLGNLENMMNQSMNERFAKVELGVDELNTNLEFTKQNLEQAKELMKTEFNRVDTLTTSISTAAENARQQLENDCNDKIAAANDGIQSCKLISDDIRKQIRQQQLATEENFTAHKTSVQDTEFRALDNLDRLDQKLREQVQSLQDANNAVSSRLDTEFQSNLQILTSRCENLETSLEATKEAAQESAEAAKNEMANVKTNFQLMSTNVTPVLERVQTTLEHLMETAKNDAVLNELKNDLVSLQGAFGQMNETMESSAKAAEDRRLRDEERFEQLKKEEEERQELLAKTAADVQAKALSDFEEKFRAAEAAKEEQARQLQEEADAKKAERARIEKEREDAIQNQIEARAQAAREEAENEENAQREATEQRDAEAAEKQKQREAALAARLEAGASALEEAEELQQLLAEGDPEGERLAQEARDKAFQDRIAALEREDGDNAEEVERLKQQKQVEIDAAAAKEKAFQDRIEAISKSSQAKSEKSDEEERQKSEASAASKAQEDAFAARLAALEKASKTSDEKPEVDEAAASSAAASKAQEDAFAARMAALEKAQSSSEKPDGEDEEKSKAASSSQADKEKEDAFQARLERISQASKASSKDEKKDEPDPSVTSSQAKELAFQKRLEEIEKQSSKKSSESAAKEAAFSTQELEASAITHGVKEEQLKEALLHKSVSEANASSKRSSVVGKSEKPSTIHEHEPSVAPSDKKSVSIAPQSDKTPSDLDTEARFERRMAKKAAELEAAKTPSAEPTPEKPELDSDAFQRKLSAKAKELAAEGSETTSIVQAKEKEAALAQEEKEHEAANELSRKLSEKARALAADGNESETTSIVNEKEAKKKKLEQQLQEEKDLEFSKKLSLKANILKADREDSPTKGYH